MLDKIFKKTVCEEIAGLHIQPGDNVWVEHTGLTTYDTMDVVLDNVRRLQGVAYIHNSGDLYLNDMLPRANRVEIAQMVKTSMEKMSTMQHSITLLDPDYNSKINVPDLMKVWTEARAPLQQIRRIKTRSLIIVTPSAPALVMGKVSGCWPPRAHTSKASGIGL